MDKYKIGVSQTDGERCSYNEYYLFPTCVEIETIVKIETVRVIHHTDSIQISMLALAFDGLGHVFSIGIEFAFRNSGDADDVIDRISEGSILIAKGCYAVLPERDGGITLYRPSFSPVYPQVTKEELKIVFATNVQ